MHDKDIKELRSWCESHIKVGNRQAKLTLELIESREAEIADLRKRCDELVRDLANSQSSVLH